MRAQSYRKKGAGANADFGQDWEELFDRYDKDGNGQLEFSEFRAAVRRDVRLTPAELPDRELARMFRRLDRDGDGAAADEAATAACMLCDGRRRTPPERGGAAGSIAAAELFAFLRRNDAEAELGAATEADRAGYGDAAAAEMAAARPWRHEPDGVRCSLIFFMFFILACRMCSHSSYPGQHALPDVRRRLSLASRCRRRRRAAAGHARTLSRRTAAAGAGWRRRRKARRGGRAAATRRVSGSGTPAVAASRCAPPARRASVLVGFGRVVLQKQRYRFSQ
jgi:hypothetical protein